MYQLCRAQLCEDCTLVQYMYSNAVRFREENKSKCKNIVRMYCIVGGLLQKFGESSIKIFFQDV